MVHGGKVHRLVDKARSPGNEAGRVLKHGKRRRLSALVILLGLATAASAIYASWDFFAEEWHMRQLEGARRGRALEALAGIGSARSIPYLIDSMNGVDVGYSVCWKDGRMEYHVSAPFHVIYRIGTRNEAATRRALEVEERMTEPVKRVLQIVDCAWKDGSAVVVPPRSWE